VVNGPSELTTSGIEQPVEVEALGEQKVMLVALVPQKSAHGPFQFEVEIKSGKFSTTKTVPFLAPMGQP
jgi:hypothetical protein